MLIHALSHTRTNLNVKTSSVSLNLIQQRILELPALEELSEWLQNTHQQEPSRKAVESTYIKGATGSLPAFILSGTQNAVSKHIPGHSLVCITATKEDAAYLSSDLGQLGNQPLLLPPSGHKPYDPEQLVDPSAVIARTDVLQQLSEGFTGIFVMSLEAAYEYVFNKANIKQETQIISIGQAISLQELMSRLADQSFKHVEFVSQPGEMALRGGILDVFPYTGSYPIRIEFFGDEIDSIREFDRHSQRSVSRLNTARLVPNLDTAAINLNKIKEEEARSTAPGQLDTVFSYFSTATTLVTFDRGRLLEKAQLLFAACEENHKLLLEQEGVDPSSVSTPHNQYLDAPAFESAFLSFNHIDFGSLSTGQADHIFHIDAKPQPSFNSSIALLKEAIIEYHNRQIETIILCDNRGQEARLHELLEEEIEKHFLSLKVESIHEGFILPDIGIALFTDHQIFNRFHRPTARKQKKKYGGISLRELRSLSPGDYIVHIDYGVGKFAGLEQITVREKQQEAVRLLFRDNDVLYVNVNALYKLHKYTGKEGHQPRLTKLGSGQWEKTKAKTKRRVKDIARDLIKLYAKRKASKGYAFPDDSLWQRELEASFQYEDTPDQRAAAEAVKRDMEQPVPMDRLVCGDVGFGKTEIAVRAAFKAAQEGKQVAILVPTTILASQHQKTFAKRLGHYPIRVDELSRFRTTKEQKETLKALKAGDVDIVVGTHRLLSKDISFKDLGLLIIDEEQRFGVAAKEKLRSLRAEVDTLSLTATPIPRTLQFSLMGARDLSIISTPPPNRQPIQTEIHTFDKDLIRDAVLHEINRGGQVFFVHNRVHNIEEIADTIRMLIPNLRVQIGHGQMKPAELERVMKGFIKHEFDVLVSTNIVENGVDVSNANTIIINQAGHFGLSDLHQLRGRVGRSNQKAFCFLLVPSIHSVTAEAKQRLQAVEEFSDLGSGFHIAMRDMDIRGAGNLLGAEQSGFIVDVGYETYHKILDEAVQELRSEEFGELFSDVTPPPPSDTVIDVEADAYIPDAYLSNNVERLNVYRRLSEANEQQAIDEMKTEIEDRFGPLPREVHNLLMATSLRNLALRLRIPKVVFKNKRLFLVMSLQNDDPYFYQVLFQPLIKVLNALTWKYVLKENKKGQLRAIVQGVENLEACIEIMKNIQPVEAEALPTAVELSS